MKIEIANDKKYNEIMVEYLISIGHEASISRDNKSYVNGESNSRVLYTLWENFYILNVELLNPNNVCIIREKIVIDSSGNVSNFRNGGVSGDVSWEYRIISRYNFTPKKLHGQESEVLFTSIDLKICIEKIFSIGWFNKELKTCVSLSVSGLPDAVDADLKMYGDQ